MGRKEQEKEEAVASGGSGGWDPDKDKLVRSLGTVRVPKDSKSWLDVSVRAYDGGPEKVAINRCVKSTQTGEDRVVRLGRLSVDEAKALGKVLGKL